MKHFVEALSSGLYLGYLPVASGTVGSLLGVAIWYGVKGSTGLHLITIALLFLIAIWAAEKGEKLFGSKDSSKIVIDEIAGFLPVMFLIPFNMLYLGMGFLIYRLFDILKPFPARRCEKMPGGWGVVMDDMIAGIYTNLILRLVLSTGFISAR